MKSKYMMIFGGRFGERINLVFVISLNQLKLYKIAVLGPLYDED